MATFLAAQLTSRRALLVNGFSGPLCAISRFESPSSQTSLFTPLEHAVPSRFPARVSFDPHLLSKVYTASMLKLNGLPTLDQPLSSKLKIYVESLWTYPDRHQLRGEASVDAYMERYLDVVVQLYEDVSGKPAVIDRELLTSLGIPPKVRSEFVGVVEDGRRVCCIEDKTPKVGNKQFVEIVRLAACADGGHVMRAVKDHVAGDGEKQPASLMNKIAWTLTDPFHPFDYAFLSDGQLFHLVRKEASTTAIPLFSISASMPLNHPQALSIFLHPFSLSSLPSIGTDAANSFTNFPKLEIIFNH